MGDSGEGLVDAQARIQERLEEREQERKRRRIPPVIDPERVRQRESLRLARAELDRQHATATHPMRRQQLGAALEELSKRIAALTD